MEEHKYVHLCFWHSMLPQLLRYSVSTNSFPSPERLTDTWSIMEVRICSFRDKHTRKPFCKKQDSDSSSGQGWHGECIQASVHFSVCWRLSWVYVRVCPYVFQRVTWNDKSLWEFGWIRRHICRRSANMFPSAFWEFIHSAFFWVTKLVQ